MLNTTRKLRDGYTTGSCLAAATLAARETLVSGKSLPAVTLRLADGTGLTIPIHEVRPGYAAVIKDGGDDPDATHGAEIRVTVSMTPEVPGEHDYLESCGSGTLLLTGGPGVGLATRPGLAVEPGKWAINPGPRRLLRSNLELAGFGRKKSDFLKVAVSVPHGREIAKQTLNPELGIVDGISILGVSGIVKPYSNAAYVATIALQLKMIHAAGGDTAALATGGRTAAALQRDFPELDPSAVIRIADFIRPAVTAAQSAGIRRLIIGCMPGKLFKYACGEENTHAHNVKLTPQRLVDFGLAPSGVDLSRINTMGELAAAVPAETFQKILRGLHPAAYRVLSAWGPRLDLTLALYNESGERII